MEKDRMEQNYFDRLPNEILLKIFQTTKTVDLMSFCNAYPQFAYLHDEKKLMNVVDLSRPAVLNNVPNFLSIVSNKLISEYITVFNMNYIYWTPAADIRKCLKKLINLKELYLLGTRMRMNQADCDCYNKLKLRKVAVLIEDRDLQISRPKLFEYVESLCVQLIRKSGFFQERFEDLIMNMKYLKELWINDMCPRLQLSCDTFLSECKELKILVFNGPYPTFYSSSSKCTDLEIILLNYPSGLQLHRYLENNKGGPINGDIDPTISWGRFLVTSESYGVSDAIKLEYGNLNNRLIKELNLRHTRSLREHYTIADKRNVIFSSNTRFLKKLSVDTCLFEDRPEHQMKSLENCQNIVELELEFKYFMKNVNEFELCICPGHEDLKLYYMPQHLKKLTHLYLEIPTAIDGQFLKPIMKNCELLHTLNIYSPRSNESFCHGFYRYISLAKNLRNLRFNHYQISFERLFFALSKIKEPKIEILYLACNTIDNFGLVNMRKFLKLNPNLTIMAIACSYITGKIMKSLKDEMKSFMNSPGKVFIVDKQEKYYDYPFAAKDFCKFQLSSSDTFVTTINVFDEFSKSHFTE